MFPVDNKYLEGYLQNAFFNDPSFGVKRNTGWLEFASHGCDYCFWMIHYRSIHPMMNLILSSSGTSLTSWLTPGQVYKKSREAPEIGFVMG